MSSKHIHHFGEDNKKDDSLTVPHVTDPGQVQYGEDAQKLREEKKAEEEKEEK